MKTYSLKKGLVALWYPFIFGFYLFCTPALARNTLHSPLSQQQTQISGIVTDGALPLSGVSISVKNQKNATVTDFDGKFVITVSANDILIFTYIGYKTIEIPVAKRLMINVQMQEDTTTLQEVKINAGYYSVKESERTGSIAKITAKDIDKQPVTNILSAMQGRMAGVTITQTTGTPGGGFDVQIRGTNSLRADGNQPLYIIDGVPYASNSISNNNISSIIIPSANVSPLSSINPSDIESIEVLKDADATAIYGSRGANGVILINTKKGKEGKTRFTINTNTAIGNVTRYMNLMHTDQYLEMRKEAFANDGINGVLNKVLFDYKYSSLPELNAVLNQYNVHADRGTEDSRVFKNNGLLYKILDKDLKPVGVPIKASDFYSKPTLKFLEERFKINQTKKETNKSHIKNAMQMAFYNEKIKSLKKLAEKLESDGIYMVLRKSKDGQLYGITYVDHKTQSVFNGSSLGKEYSAKGILERCEQNIFNYEKQYYKSIPNPIENFQNLKSTEFSKINIIDNLLRAENLNDYEPKQFKQKKKKSIRRGIK